MYVVLFSLGASLPWAFALVSIFHTHTCPECRLTHMWWLVLILASALIPNTSISAVLETLKHLLVLKQC